MTTKEITDYIFLDDEIEASDVAIVFGSWNAWSPSIGKTADLYTKGLFKKIVLSGGLNEKTKIIEAYQMAEEAERLGIPKEHIIIEDKATNTLENVLFSLEKIDTELGINNIKSIGAIVKDWHARRTLMTLKKHVPPHITIKSVSYISSLGFNKLTWTKSDLGKKIVKEEMQKIEKYLKKGDITEI